MSAHRRIHTSLAIEVHSLSKTFGTGRPVLQGVNLMVAPGEMVALIGASGSGKSTLLRHLAGLMAGDPGSDSSIHVHGRIVQMQGLVARDIRATRTEIGFVSGQGDLVGRLPVLANVLTGLLHRMPLWRSLTRVFKRAERVQAVEALRRVGMADCAAQRASTLSGGQQQLVAIARALAQRARVVLADDPVAALEPEASRKVMDMLSTLNKEDCCTVLVSLQQVNVATRYCARTVALHQGQVVYDGPSAALTPGLVRRLYGIDAERILAAADAFDGLDEARAPRNTSSWGQAALRPA